MSEGFKAAATAAVGQLFATGNLTIDVLSIAAAQPAPETAVGAASGAHPAAVILDHAAAVPQSSAAASQFSAEDMYLPHRHCWVLQHSIGCCPGRLCWRLQPAHCCAKSRAMLTGQMHFHSVHEAHLLHRAAASNVSSALWMLELVLSSDLTC